MSGNQQDLRYEAGKAVGQAQTKKDELMDRAGDSLQSAKESCQDGAEQAGSFLQQKGEEAKSMAQGVADAVKNN